MASLRRDLLSSYVLSLSRIGAWAAVSSVVYRACGKEGFADLTVARSGVSILAVVGAAVAPIVLREIAGSVESGRPTVLSPRLWPAQVFAAAAMGLLLPVSFLLSPQWQITVVMAAGMAARVFGDIAGTALQARHRLATDNFLTASGEILWAGTTCLLAVARPGGEATAFGMSPMLAAVLFFFSGLIIAGLRFQRAKSGDDAGGGSDPPIQVSALAPAGWLFLSGLADFCYAPLNVALLARWSGPGAVAAYAPALQVDAALLLLTSAFSGVVMQRGTSLLARGEPLVLRRLYLRGTLATTIVLVLASAAVAVMARPLLRAWLGPDVSPLAPALLMGVLLHTVVGGSSGIGRSVVIAAGRARTLSLVYLAFGLANIAGVACVLLFTPYGAAGVVAVTVVSVGLRCGIWLPWYTLRALRLAGGRSDAKLASSPSVPTGTGADHLER